MGSTLVSNPQEFQEDYLEFASDIAGLLIHLYGWVCSGPRATLLTLCVCVCVHSCVPPSPHCSPVNSRTQSEIDSNILLVVNKLL